VDRAPSWRQDAFDDQRRTDAEVIRVVERHRADGGAADGRPTEEFVVAPAETVLPTIPSAVEVRRAKALALVPALREGG
jgi:hypothetical protein